MRELLQKCVHPRGIQRGRGLTLQHPPHLREVLAAAAAALEELHGHVLLARGTHRVGWPQLSGPVHVLEHRHGRGVALPISPEVHHAGDVEVPVLKEKISLKVT